MPPRKSLPNASASTSTPRRAAAIAAESALDASSNRSGRRGTKRKHGEDEVAPTEEEKPLGIEAEKELEAWQDFAAEHYEMVEQLPLELHRNFRLLKELDVGCIGQMERLHALIREYVKQRIALVKPPDKVAEDMDVDPPPNGTAESGCDGATTGEEAKEVHEGESIEGEGKEETAKTLEPAAPDDRDHSEVDENLVPVADGEGGIIAIPESEAEEAAQPRNPFPSEKPEGRDEGATAATDSEEVATGAAQEAGSIAPSGAAREGAAEDGVLPWTMLQDIGKFAREIVRNAEEKVAVAVGAYNAIDRHIRALDSALSAQEASILLGLRPSTFPSSALDATLHPNEAAGFANGEEGEITIGMGGGGRRKKNKKGRKSEVAPLLEAPLAEVPGLEGIEAMEANADPNEPRYCVCNRVSFGVMIGCDNDDCPTEWYHLPCVGLLAEPTGKWLCPICRPHGVGVAAAAANLGAGSEHVKVPPSNGQKKGKKVVPKGASRRKR